MAGSPAAALAHRGLAWAALLLAFVGWIVLLGGVASLQQACPHSMITTTGQLAELAAGAGRRLHQNLDTTLPGFVGYLAPVGCNKFLSYVWWIWAFDLFVLCLLAAGVTTLIGTLRGTLVAISAVLLVLLMDTANTFLYFNHINGITGTAAARARVIVAGAIISSIAYFLLIAVVGWHDEDVGVSAPFDAEAAGMTRKRKGQGVGGALSGFFGGRKRAEGERREEEEPAGAGIPGSPRIVSVPRAPVVAQPAGGAGGGPTSGAAPMAAAGPITTTTATYVTTAAVPVSTTAAPISANAAPAPTAA